MGSQLTSFDIYTYGSSLKVSDFTFLLLLLMTEWKTLLREWIPNICEFIQNFMNNLIEKVIKSNSWVIGIVTYTIPANGFVIIISYLFTIVKETKENLDIKLNLVSWSTPSTVQHFPFLVPLLIFYFQLWKQRSLA